MFELFSTFSIDTVILILCLAIPALIKGITWIINTISAAKKRRGELRQEGAQDERAAQQVEERFHAGEERIAELEREDKKIESILEKQQQQIDLLIRSDELDIKAWTKQQHEHWMHIGAIDSESLSLVIDRYEIYAEEGGNSWAERMVNDIKSLPIVTAIELRDYVKKD